MFSIFHYKGMVIGIKIKSVSNTHLPELLICCQVLPGVARCCQVLRGLHSRDLLEVTVIHVLAPLPRSWRKVGNPGSARVAVFLISVDALPFLIVALLGFA